jgi:hypothetical protein
VLDSSGSAAAHGVVCGRSSPVRQKSKTAQPRRSYRPRRRSSRSAASYPTRGKDRNGGECQMWRLGRAPSPVNPLRHPCFCLPRPCSRETQATPRWSLAQPINQRSSTVLCSDPCIRLPSSPRFPVSNRQHNTSKPVERPRYAMLEFPRPRIPVDHRFPGSADALASRPVPSTAFYRSASPPTNHRKPNVDPLFLFLHLVCNHAPHRIASLCSSHTVPFWDLHSTF